MVAFGGNKVLSDLVERKKDRSNLVECEKVLSKWVEGSKKLHDLVECNNMLYDRF